MSKKAIVPYRRKIYKPLNSTSSRILRVAAFSRIAQEFRIVLPAKVKGKNSTRSVYSLVFLSVLHDHHLLDIMKRLIKVLLIFFFIFKKNQNDQKIE